MTGKELKLARQSAGWTQIQAAKKLGVSQAYVSMLERERRPVAPARVARVLKHYRLPPLALPFHGHTAWADLDDQSLAEQLAGLGHPGFAYMRAQPVWNPAELLLAALDRPQLERRTAEALPWLALKYYEMDWEWAVREAKLRDGQNRLGFVVTLARELAELKSDAAAGRLLEVEESLRRSRLAREDTFANEGMTQAERRWLREHASAGAQKWGLLSDMAKEYLTHAH